MPRNFEPCFCVPATKLEAKHVNVLNQDAYCCYTSETGYSPALHVARYWKSNFNAMLSVDYNQRYTDHFSALRTAVTGMSQSQVYYSRRLLFDPHVVVPNVSLKLCAAGDRSNCRNAVFVWNITSYISVNVQISKIFYNGKMNRNVL